jgi:hypothetical protein
MALCSGGTIAASPVTAAGFSQDTPLYLSRSVTAPCGAGRCLCGVRRQPRRPARDRCSLNLCPLLCCVEPRSSQLPSTGIASTCAMQVQRMHAVRQLGECAAWQVPLHPPHPHPCPRARKPPRLWAARGVSGRQVGFPLGWFVHRARSSRTSAPPSSVTRLRVNRDLWPASWGLATLLAQSRWPSTAHRRMRPTWGARCDTCCATWPSPGRGGGARPAWRRWGCRRTGCTAATPPRGCCVRW